MTIGKWNAALLLAAAGLSAGTPALAQITGKLVNPNVLLVIDSSRSMDWLQLEEFEIPPATSEFPGAMAREAAAHNACVDANTAESPRQTSWQQLLDVMLGSIPSDDFHCFVEEPESRPGLQYDTLADRDSIPANISEYTSSPSDHFRAISCSDEDWHPTYGQCIGSEAVIADLSGTVTASGHWCKNNFDYDGDGEEEINYDPTTGICFNYHTRAKARSANGILERYRTLARFGIMTYDNKPSPLSTSGEADPLTGEVPAHIGWFDYGASRKWNCKKWSGLPELPGAGCTWNAGARARNDNAVGGLAVLSDDMESSNKAARDVLATTEPLYCSPVGALLDDVGHFFGNEVGALPAGRGGSDLFYNCRPKVVIFISDGQPNQAFEFPEDYCATNPPPAPGDTAVVPAEPYSCPWNSSKQEVVELEALLEELTLPTATVENMYFVVVGFNAAKKGEVYCTPELVEDVVTGETICVPGDERCIQIATIDAGDDADCTADKFLTPRQFLNELALAGWPEDYTTQPPWRGTTPLSDLCSDETVDDSCGGEDGDGRPNGAIFVDGPAELSGVLDLILSTVTSSTATRTEVVTTDQVKDDNYDAEWSEFVAANEDGEAVAQFEFNSGFEVVGGEPWRGYLYRQSYPCVDAEAPEADTEPEIETLDKLHHWLNTQATRHIYTITDATLASVKPSYGNYFQTGFPKGTLELISEASAGITDCDLGGPSTAGCATSKSILAALKKHLYGEGDSLRAEHKLADIYNSTPALLAPPMERISVASYQAFQELKYTPVLGGDIGTKHNVQRPPFLYVGTNDGVLHSFDIWGDENNVEMWGYVPNALLGGVVRQYPITWNLQYDPDALTWSYEVEESGLYQHIFGVDGSPVAADVRLFRMPPGTTGASLPDSPDNWRSVVVGGLGKGGAGYYALDVTNPEDEPLFRWEISERFPGNNEDSAFEDGSGKFVFGLPIGKPALTYVYINDVLPIGTSSTAADHEVAVAILPGGYKNDEENGPEVSTGVAIVRVGDGKLIRYLNPAVAADLCSEDPADVTPAQLVGEPAVPYPLRALTVNDEAFIGDDRGRLWRIDMASKYPSGNSANKGWCLELFFDTLLTTHFPYKDCIAGACSDCPYTADAESTCDEYYAADGDWGTEACTGQPCEDPLYPFPRIPITNAPTIVQDEDRNNVILFGTGQIDGLEALDHHRIFSLTQRLTYEIAESTAVPRTVAQPPTINWWLGEPIPGSDTLEPEEIADLSAQEQEMLEVEMSFVQLGSAFPALFNMGEKMLGRVAVFNGVAYFTTFIPAIVDGGSSIDACLSGGSRVWGVDYNGNESGSDWTLEAFGKLGSSIAYEETLNELQSGLKVVRRPSCSGQAQFQLVTQRANPDAAGTKDTTQDAPAQISSLSVTIPQSSRGFTNVSIDSWSLVFN
ncbi:MAG: PilC/PilY family type IV pilus protein [Proteobacteria bacterium]|jgi:hypothetical protein|nr:PilC/PilY family type IV pilus protein [Pseudomonadota bacterium]